MWLQACVYVQAKKKGPAVGSYRCSYYNNNENHACTHHYIQKNTLSAFVLRDIQIKATLAKADKERMKQQLSAVINISQQNSMKQINKQLKAAETREATIDVNIKRLDEDKYEGNLLENAISQLKQSRITADPASAGAWIVGLDSARPNKKLAPVVGY